VVAVDLVEIRGDPARAAGPAVVGYKTDYREDSVKAHLHAKTPRALWRAALLTEPSSQQGVASTLGRSIR
jgi:hypothetical protein